MKWGFSEAKMKNHLRSTVPTKVRRHKKNKNILLSQIAFAKPQRQRQAALADTALVRPMCNSATLTKGDSATPSHHPFPTSDSRTVTGATCPYAVYFPHKYIFSLLRIFFLLSSQAILQQQFYARSHIS